MTDEDRKTTKAALYSLLYILVIVLVIYLIVWAGFYFGDIRLILPIELFYLL